MSFLLLYLLIAVVLFLKKPKAADGIAEEDLLRLSEENNRLQITLGQSRRTRFGSGYQKGIKPINYYRTNGYDTTLAVTALNQELLAEKNRMAKAEESFKAQRERLAEQERSIQEIQQKFQLEFQNIANKLLDEKSQKFVETNKTHLDILLNPLKENIKAFEEKVDKVYNMEAAERNTLKGVISAADGVE